MKSPLILIICLFFISVCHARDYKLLSPNKKIELRVSVGATLEFSIYNNGNLLLANTPLNLVINKQELLTNSRVQRIKNTSIHQTIFPVIKIKSAKITDKYNELGITFKGNYTIIFRAYDEGVAYRVQTEFKNDITVDGEQLILNLPDSAYGYLMKVNGFNSMAEEPYVPSYVRDYSDSSLFALPCLFKIDRSFLLVTESDVEDYPGLWFKKDNGKIVATLPGKVKTTNTDNCLGAFRVTEREGYLATTKGTRSFPWRVFAVGETEKDLITNQLVYLLAKPSAGDFSWVEPGLATLDWWGRRNVFGTNFKGGVNTATQKYFIDFNNKYGVKYFVLDDGWSASCDLKDVNKNINLDSLKTYAEQKNVGLVFWAHTFALAQDVEGYMDFLKSKGAAGLKVDFFRRDDQDAVNLMHKIVREAAKRKLVLDFHGITKPFGLNRTYPNLLTSEGLVEFEMNGVTDWANPQHHTLLPFIRMVTGPMDYLPGTFNNAQKKEFAKIIDRPMGLGSRAHAMALAVVLESPMTMWPDSPSDYLQEDECTRFLSRIPVIWDETKVLDAKIGEYVVIARRNGDKWYIGAITNWTARKIQLQLSFLSAGDYKLEAITDGPNTGTRAIDYKRESKVVNSGTNLELSSAQGGGWVGIISK